MIKKQNTKKEKADLYLKKLKEKLAYYKQVVIDSSDAIIIQDFNGSIRAWNKSAERIYGFREKEMLGKNIISIIAKENRAEAIKNIKNIKKGRPTFVVRQKRITKSGEEVFVNITYSPIYESEEIVEIATSEADITELKKSLAETKKSEESYKSLVENTLDYIYLIDKRCKIISVNSSAKKILSVKFKNIIGKKVSEIFPKEVSKNYISSIKKVFLTGKPLSIKGSKMIVGDHVSWLSVTLSPVKDFEGVVTAVIGVSHDITSEMEIENKLEQSEKKYRRLFEDTRDGILLLEVHSGKILDSNPSIQQMLGYSKEELIGKKIFEISSFKDVFDNKNKFLKFKNEKYVRYDSLSLKTKTGDKVYVEFVSNVYGTNGDTIIQCNIRDISERKQLDEAKSGFLSLASHQLRTPLSMTKWVLESLTYKEQNLTDDQKEKINTLVYSNERLIKLVNNLLSVSTIDTGKLAVNKKLTNINQLIFDLSESFKKLADSKKKTIKIFLPLKPVSVYCDPFLVHEALENLFTNAIDYSDENSPIIKVSFKNHKKCFSISVNNGGIIDPISYKKISSFDKFVRGNNASEKQPSGSGLGLYITKKVIEANGGKIGFVSNAKSGTTFFIKLFKGNYKE